MNKRNDLFYVYTKRKNNCDQLVINFYDREYELNYNIDKRQLACAENVKIREFMIDRDCFDRLAETVKENFGRGSEDFRRVSYEKIVADRASYAEKELAKPQISAETLKKALRLELNGDKLARIASHSVRYEHGDYYDFPLMEKTVSDYRAGKIEKLDFGDWCFIYMKIFLDEGVCLCRNEKIREYYKSIGDDFDARLFTIGTYEENIDEHLAFLRFVNHEIENEKNKKHDDYEKNGVSVYHTFEAYVGGKAHYKRLYVDKNKRRINLRYVYAPDFDPELRITFVSAREMEDLLNEYHDGYEFDAALDESAQLA